ncbi:MAG: PrsW family glutamic-type intramembrane protease, partial [Chloroflexi bacterium]|nr:PrsW family glutamic-type intramembrane protease [Chloroflexota bacterium]
RSHAELLALDTFLHRASPFAHLPSEAIRRLAGQMRVRRCDAGEIVVREGDEGSRFYLVRSGRFEVVRRGRRLQILDEGDSFGEVALLTGVRRIATVRALDAAEVLSLTKAELLAVVQEHESLQRQFAEFVRIRAGEALARAVDVRVSPAVPAPPAGPRPLRLGYLKFLLAGVAVFAVLSFLASWTAAPPAIYAALAVGSFVGPVAYVLYLAESALLPEKPLPLIITFLLTAAVGIPLAMRLHEWTGAWPGSLQSGLLIGLTEETVKIFGVLWLLRRSASRFQMDGVIYGAAAGMGFAAFENLIYGYAQMGAVGTLLSTLWARTLLSPFGHGAWTAIIAAAIWRSKSDGGVRGALRIAGAFLLSVGLHGLWDWQPFDGVALHLWLAAIGLVGVEILRVIIARATRETAGAILALNPQAQSAGAPGAHSFVCGACGSESPAGTHYCVRCGAALRLARGG